MNKVRVEDRPLTIKIVNEKKNYHYTYDRLISGYSFAGTSQKNGYLAYDENGEELGIVYEHDVPSKKTAYQCAEILFFKKYKNNHQVGIWRMVQPTGIFGIEVPYRLMRNNYIQFNLLEKELAEKGFLIVTTAAAWHKE